MLKKHPVNVLMKRRMNYMLKTKIKCTSIYISKLVIAQKTQPIISRSFEMTIHLQDVQPYPKQCGCVGFMCIVCDRNNENSLQSRQNFLLVKIVLGPQEAFQCLKSIIRQFQILEVTQSHRLSLTYILVQYDLINKEARQPFVVAMCSRVH